MMNLVDAFKECIDRQSNVAEKVMLTSIELANQGKVDEAKQALALANEIRTILNPLLGKSNEYKL